MKKEVVVRAPATSANLGPGFDCLGLALSLFSEFSFSESEELLIEGCPEAFQNEENLSVRAFGRVYEKAGAEPPKLHLRICSQIPVARGLGSSSACIAAGAVAANVFLGNRFSKEELFQLCTEMEGHPDNVAPCLFGGLTASFTDGGKAVSLPFSCAPKWEFVTMIPDYEIQTAEARKAVKQERTLSDAVYTASHAIAMVRGLETGDSGVTAAACRDILHEPYRKVLIPDYEALKALCLTEGAVTFFISGSGSTMIALCDTAQGAASLREKIAAACPAFEVLCLRADTNGTEVIG